MIRYCSGCRTVIPAARLDACPDTWYCVDCQSRSDVPRVEGYLSWEHKTAPTTIIGKAASLVRPYDRRGFKTAAKVETRISSGIGFRGAVETIDADVVNTPRARCHPQEPRINAYGQCLDCALRMQADRVTHRALRG